MKRTLGLLVAVAMLALITVGPAFAAGGGHGVMHRHQNQIQAKAAPEELPGRQYFTLVGTITGVGDESVDVQIYSGNRFVKEYIGDPEEELTVAVHEDTEYWTWAETGCTQIEEGDIGSVSVGDTASVRGMVSEGGFLADRITLGVPLDCCTP